MSSTTSTIFLFLCSIYDIYRSLYRGLSSLCGLVFRVNRKYDSRFRVGEDLDLDVIRIEIQMQVY